MQLGIHPSNAVFHDFQPQMAALVKEILEFQDGGEKIGKVMDMITEGPFAYLEFKAAVDDTNKSRQVWSE
jgi:hypothetical protein